MPTEVMCKKEAGYMKKYYEAPLAIAELVSAGDIMVLSAEQKYNDDNLISWAELTDGMTL